MVWRRKVSDPFSHLESDPKSYGQLRPMGEVPFVRECHEALSNLYGSSDLSRPQKELYQVLVVGSASDHLVDRFGWLMEEVRSH